MSHPIEKKYRYPGVTPFTTEQANVFFGRRQDTEELYRLIIREPLVVLYSKSGLGKSSLINAGVIPECQKDKIYNPLIIRFGAWTESTTSSPLSVIKNALHALKKETILTKLFPSDNSLWRHAKEKQLIGDGKFLLIFDQFEEIFSYPESQIGEFQQEILELINTSIPLRFRRALDKFADIKDEEEDVLESPLDSRILFAIRSDRMHLLDKLTRYLPNVLRNCFELKALKNEDARDAIVAPAQVAGDFKTLPFKYSEQALTNLLLFLEDGQERRVEGILLQMLCENYEIKQVDAEAKQFLDVKDIGNPNDVVKNYYDEKLRSFDATEQNAVRLLIEEGLVSDGEAMRLTLHEAYIMQEYKLSKPLLEKLVNSRLLRSEPFLRGGYTYELSHDRLIAPVLGARNQRRKEEQSKEKERLQKIAEKERLEKIEVQKRLRMVRIMLAISLFALMLAGYFAYDATKQKKIAEFNEAKAITNERKAQESLDKFLVADNMRKETEVNGLISKAENYLNFNQKELAIKALKEALAIDSTNIIVHQKLNTINENQ